MYCTGETGFPDRIGGVPYLIVHGSVDAVLIIFAICCNMLIIFAILRYHRRLKLAGMLPCPNHASVRLVLSLCIADIITALGSVYFLLFEYSCDLFYTWGMNQWLCIGRFAPYMMTAAASCFSLMGLAIDRYVAVVHALRYREIMTSRVTNVMILCNWIGGGITGGILIFWNKWTPTSTCEEFNIVPLYYVTAVCITFATVAVSVMGVLHWLVHREAQAAFDRKKSMNSVYKPKSNPPTNGMNSKSARVMYMIVGAIIVLWTPVTTMVVLRSLQITSPVIDLIYGWTLTFYNLTYVVNSFIYSWKNSTIKLAILQVFGKSLRKPSMSSVRTNSVMQHSTISDFTSTSSNLNVA